MFCKHCGAEITDLHNGFCENCGKKIREESKQKTASKTYVIISVAVLVVIVAVIGGFVLVHSSKEKKEIESFQKEVDQFKIVKENYKLGALKTDYESLLNQSNSCIEDKKISRIDTLSGDMEKLISAIKRQDEQVKQFEEKMKTVKKTVEVYNMSTSKKADFQMIMDSYKDAIDQCDINECKEAEQKAESFLKALVKENAKVKVKVKTKTKTKIVVKRVKEPQKSVISNDSGYQSEFIFWDSNSRYLNVSELISLSDWELKIARNEIYARRGRCFVTREIQDYFNACAWYSGRISANSFNPAVFNKYEKANIDLIQRYEKAN